MSVDSFGVPDNFFGTTDETFFGAIGRITALSALIEYQALTVLQTMTNSPQNAYSQLGASQIVDKARSALGPPDDDEGKNVLLQYFRDVEALCRARNDYVHNLWPSQHAGSHYGWRMNPDKKTRDTDPFVSMQVNTEEIRSFIAKLVELVHRRDHVWVAACAEQKQRIDSGGAS